MKCVEVTSQVEINFLNLLPFSYVAFRSQANTIPSIQWRTQVSVRLAPDHHTQ